MPDLLKPVAVAGGGDNGNGRHHADTSEVAQVLMSFPGMKRGAALYPEPPSQQADQLQLPMPPMQFRRLANDQRW